MENLNNDHYLGVPRVVVVHRLNCNLMYQRYFSRDSLDIIQKFVAKFISKFVIFRLKNKQKSKLEVLIPPGQKDVKN
jgi:hypothetical protein